MAKSIRRKSFAPDRPIIKQLFGERPRYTRAKMDMAVYMVSAGLPTVRFVAWCIAGCPPGTTFMPGHDGDCPFVNPFAD